MGDDLEMALAILEHPNLAILDVERMSSVDLHLLRNLSETHRRVTKLWLASANRVVTSKGKIDRELMARVNRADAIHAERIRLAARGFVHLKMSRNVGSVLVDNQAHDAQESCRRLAGEVERLSEELSAAKHVAGNAQLHRAFYEAAQFILADSTFRRIREKAMQLLTPKKT